MKGRMVSLLLLPARMGLWALMQNHVLLGAPLEQRIGYTWTENGGMV